MTQPIWNWPTALKHFARGLVKYPFVISYHIPWIVYRLLIGDIHKSYEYTRAVYAACWPRWFSKHTGRRFS